jgi:hypothetical protein
MMSEQSKLTPPKWYVNQDEQVIPASAVDRHHIVFPRDEYRHRVGLNFRSLGGFVHRISIVGHRELHANVEPPVIAHELIEAITFNQRNMGNLEPLERLQYTINYLGYLGADELVDNLIRQKHYIELGAVVLLGDK